MADQASIFPTDNTSTQTTTAAPAAAPAQQPDAFANLLSSVKNERGEQKYKDVNEAFNGLKHAQEYIPQLKTELSTKEQALAAANQRIQELLEANNSLLSLTSTQAPQSTPAPQGLDEKAVAELVARSIQERENATTSQQNVATVVSTLQSVFGADAEKAFYGKAAELGMSVPEMNALAAKSPKAVLKMLGVGEGAPKTNGIPNTSAINTTGFNPHKESFVGRNTKPMLIGATSEDYMAETRNSRAMVDELHAQGLSVHQMSDPKVYAKYFKKA